MHIAVFLTSITTTHHTLIRQPHDANWLELYSADRLRALQILVKIADDIPHAKLSHRGIEQIIRAHQIDLDEDTMDMMCEKTFNAVAG